MFRFSFFVFVCFVLMGGACSWAGAVSDKLVFESAGNQLMINGYESVPPFDEDIHVYEAVTLNTQSETTIAFGNQVKKINLKNIRKNEYILLVLNQKKYKLYLYPKDLPSYKIKSNTSHSKGLLLFTPYVACNSTYPAYAMAVDTNRKVVFYHKNIKGGGISDFKKTVLKDGQIRYSFMYQEEPNVSGCFYMHGSLFVFDEKFRLLNKLRLKPFKDRPELPIENHDSLLIDDDHYFLSAYHNSEQLHPAGNQVLNITSLVLQEIKNDNVIFEFDSANYPELYLICNRCDWNSPQWQDSVHFNSILIDPKDNNLILSFANISAVVKIDRKTGKILWQLGGKNDDFSLLKHQFFLGQHALSFDHEGNLMLYDNSSRAFLNFPVQQWLGNVRKTSRILKFKLDEKNRKVIGFKEIPLNYKSHSMGAVYQLKDPNRYFVSYGSNKDVSAQEIDLTGKAYLTLRLERPYTSYKVQLTDWPLIR